MLAAHIRNVELWPSDKGYPEDEAADFLSFVRQKAGLLVEAGPDLYSFVHLTFQEYPAARHIITCSESRGGDIFVWSKIAQKIDEPRWNEVVRLLIGARESEESQRALVDLILSAASDVIATSIPAVLAGLLLDRVPAAEEQRAGVLTVMLKALAQKGDDSVALASMLSALIARPDNYSVFESCFNVVWHDLEDVSDKFNLILAAFATSYPADHLLRWLGELEKSDWPQARFLAQLLGYQSQALEEADFEVRWENLVRVLISLARENIDSNPVAAALCSVFPPQGARYIVAIQLAMLRSTRSLGRRNPFTDFTGNLLFLHAPEKFENAWKYVEAVEEERDERPRAKQMLDRLRKLLSNKGLNSVLEEYRREAQSPSIDSIISRGRGAGLGMQQRPDRAEFWSRLVSSKEMQDILLDILLTGLNLSPPGSGQRF
ncbi:NACHT domain-containing protein [Bradyrhizobium betae]